MGLWRGSCEYLAQRFHADRFGAGHSARARDLPGRDGGVGGRGGVSAAALGDVRGDVSLPLIAAAGGPGALAPVSRNSSQSGDLRPGESLRSEGRDGAGYRPGDGSPAGAARKEHGGGPSGDSRRGRLGQDDDPGLPRAVPGAGARQQAHPAARYRVRSTAPCWWTRATISSRSG